MTLPISRQVDPDMARWCLASVMSHLRTVNQSISEPPPLSFSGYSLNAEENEDHVEIRVQGPYTKDVPGYLVLEMPVSMLMTFRQDEVKDIHTLDRWLGKYADELRKPIEIRKKGSGLCDDDSLLFCMQPKKSKRELIRIDRFGFVDGNTPVQQATVIVNLDGWFPWEN